MRQTLSRLWYCPGLLCVLLTGMVPLAAQTLYRCGNTYQDKPCSNGQQGKVVTILKGAEAKDGLLDVNCSQKGQDAQKIMWARESGMTEKEMLDKAKTASERELVMSVYRQRGSSAQIRQSVEAACIADKDRHAATGVPPAREGSMPGEGKSVAASTAAAAAASTSGKALCEKMRSEMGALLGKDGSKEQREAVASALKNAGCQGG